MTTNSFDSDVIILKTAYMNVFQEEDRKIYIGTYDSKEEAALADPENKRIETIPCKVPEDL